MGRRHRITRDFQRLRNANLMKMWVLAAKNRLYASQNRLTANTLANEIRSCIAIEYGLHRQPA